MVCLAGILASFAGPADDILRRLAGLHHVSGSTTERLTEETGQRLQAQHRAGTPVRPAVPQPAWDFRLEEHPGTAAFVGPDAFSVPMQGPKGKKAEHRMLYVGLLYTPDKRHTVYLTDFDLDRLAGQLRLYAIALGLSQAGDVVAIFDGGNGLEGALKRSFWDDLVCILDWYHAAGHLHAFAAVQHPGDAARAGAWAQQAKGVLYEQGGTALLNWLRQVEASGPEAAEELRKLVQYFQDNEHRTDYPSYRAKGWDIGSGPTEAGCKVIGARLKGAGMRWSEEGAEPVAALRCLYLSGEGLWDGFWAQPRAAA